MLVLAWEYGGWVTALALLALGIAALWAARRHHAVSLALAGIGFLLGGACLVVLALNPIPLLGGAGATQWAIVSWAHPAALAGLVFAAVCFAWFAFAGAVGRRT